MLVEELERDVPVDGQLVDVRPERVERRVDGLVAAVGHPERLHLEVDDLVVDGYLKEKKYSANQTGEQPPKSQDTREVLLEWE